MVSSLGKEKDTAMPPPYQHSASLCHPVILCARELITWLVLSKTGEGAQPLWGCDSGGQGESLPNLVEFGMKCSDELTNPAMPKLAS